LASQRIANQPYDDVRPAGATATNLSNAGQGASEKQDLAPEIPASETADANLKRQGNTQRRQVLQRSNVTAVARIRDLFAPRAHFPATIADLYDPDKMPDDLRHAHDRNDEVLERIYIGRRFKNDTERLERLFDLYTKITASAAPTRKRKAEPGE
jgi:hypothetical protein